MELEIKPKERIMSEEGFEMNLSLKGKYAAGQPARKLVSGIYKGVIGKVEGRNEGTRALFVIEVIDDKEMAGLTAVSSMRIATSKDDKVLHYWRAAAESCGYSHEEINEINNWNDKHFKGRTCWFEYKAGDKKNDVYPEVIWLVPSAVKLAVKRFETETLQEGSLEEWKVMSGE